jgi:glutamate racemase
VTQTPKILVFDSGLGGLTVYREIARLRPKADCIYLADDAQFPYGALSEAGLVSRAQAVLNAAIAEYAPDLVVIACNTASTLVLPPLRAAYPALPFVGTVPAIKPAAERSRSQMISVLATPGTVARDYTRTLIAMPAIAA